MNRWIGILFFCSSLYSTLCAALPPEETERQARQAMALFAAQDYNKALQIYQNLLDDASMEEQKALLNYNIGTIKIAQNQPLEALKTFYSISFDQISSLLLLRYLKTNEGIAYLKQATDLISQAPDSLTHYTNYLNYLLERSIQNFTQATKGECLIQAWQEEQETACVPSSDLETLHQQASKLLAYARQKQRQELISTLPLSVNQTLILDGLQKIEKLMLNKNIEMAYILSQATKLDSLWEQLKNQSLSEEDKISVDKASKLYETAMESLTNSKTEQATSSFKEAARLLKEISIDEKIKPLEQLLFNYALLLTAQQLSSESIFSILEEQNKIEDPFKEHASFKLSQQALSSSLEAIKKDQQSLARLFLNAGFYLLDRLLFSNTYEEEDPKQLLKSALKEAKQLLNLNFLYQEAGAVSAEKIEFIRSLLLDIQKRVIDYPPVFIQAVLRLEKKRFQKEQDPLQTCQKDPWSQVIPLFQKGYKELLLGAKETEHSLFENALPHQELTVLNWEKALAAFEKGEGSQGQADTSEDQQNSSEQETPADKIFQDIQEMQLQDTPENKGQNEDLYTW